MSRLTSNRSGVTYVLNSDTVGRANVPSLGAASKTQVPTDTRPQCQMLASRRAKLQMPNAFAVRCPVV